MFKPVIDVHPSKKERILKNYQHLKYAQDVTGVAWQAIAAIWYRESGCNEKVSIAGGPMQFDPEPSRQNLRNLLDTYTKLNSEEKTYLLYQGVINFKSSFVFAACFLQTKRKCKELLTISSSDEDYAEAFYGYNGRAYGSYEKSPYVMNGYDQDRSRMIIKGTINGSPVRSVDSNPGALVIYKRLCHWFPHRK